MGLIKAAVGAIGGSLADQWLEAYEPSEMGEGVVFCKGSRVRQGDRRDSNVKGSSDAISNGSAIHVYDRQMALLVDSGKIVDFAAEPGVYTVSNSSLPSMFAGQFGDSLKESFNRFRFGGANPTRQQVFYVNLQEIKGIKFGTRNALQYFDNFYNAELFLRAHGTYSIAVTDPILFYQEAIPRNASRVRIEDINEQYISEFLEALQASINQMSVDGIRISQVSSKMTELSDYMQDCLDEDWKRQRGMEVRSVGIASVSYDESSRELIDMRNKGAMLSDANVRDGYVQGSIARGLEAAGSNEGGAAASFLGMGIGMQGGAAAVGAFGQANQAARAQDAAASTAAGWTCPACEAANQGKFCSNCGQKRPETGGFCGNCGKRFQAARPKFCPDCGQAQ